MNRKLPRLVPIVMLVVLSAFGATSTTPAYDKHHPRVAPRDSKPHGPGMTYEEWAAALLQWVYSQPVDASPLSDTTGTLTQQAESGKVWFLPGPSELVPQPQKLFLTMPAGTALFFSPLGFYGAGPTPFCPTAEQCVDFVKSHPLAGGVAAQDVEIDGVPVSNIDQFLILSPVVPLHVPANGFWVDFVGKPGPFTFGVFGGFGLFIRPLAPGQHVIHARTTARFGRVAFEITYTITVTPCDDKLGDHECGDEQPDGGEGD